MTDSHAMELTNRLLIATPQMGDPRFKDAVIYVCSHDSSGAMGLVINKQVVKSGNAFQLSDMLSNIGIEGDVKVADTPVLEGGPVDIDRGFVLHSSDYFKTETSLKLTDTLHLTSTKDVLEALVQDNAPTKAMLAVGYSGWGAGQVERELQDNAWIVADADETLIFDPNLNGKWTKALASLGIKPEMLSRHGGSA
ncbi:YqgE/AlgH family protein [Hellea balneolensis]|uniref:YqgE/AlgH family protein n=1 Tax=Hellea balneolensis TaxID=287478 RepID=UPI00047E5E06|nr:YqgE/AlgH family protein [Hellea balneolensis]